MTAFLTISLTHSGRSSDNRIGILDPTVFSESNAILDQDDWFYKENPTTFKSDALGFVGDIDGDSLSDFAVGLTDYGTYDEGGIALYLSTQMAQDFGTETVNNHSLLFFGDFANNALYSFSTGGDLDGDGLGDLIVNNRYYKENFSTVGAVHLFLGSALLSNLGNTLSPTSSDYLFVGLTGGISLSIDGDGVPDYVISGQDGLCTRCGEHYIYFGSNLNGGPSTLTKSMPIDRFWGNSTGII